MHRVWLDDECNQHDGDDDSLGSQWRWFGKRHRRYNAGAAHTTSELGSQLLRGINLGSFAAIDRYCTVEANKNILSTLEPCH